MAHISAKTRIEATKPRSLSISDTAKLDAALSSLRLEGTSKEEKKSDGVHVQEMSGVFLKRIPLIEANFETGTTIPSYQYHVENKRSYDVTIIMTFNGENCAVKSASSAFSQPVGNAVQGIVAKDKGVPFALLEAADKSKDFSFSADIKIFPVHDDIREADLEGVKLFTIIAYSGITAKMIFEAQNTKEFDVEVELDLRGELKERISLPLKRVVRVGERVVVGEVKSDGEVETSWKWTGLSQDTPNPLKSHVQTSELKGVTLKQTLTPGNPTLIQFDVVNGREKRIRVEIDMTGDAEIDFRDQPRPLTGAVLAGKTTFIGVVAIRGDAEVNWRFKEETD